MITPQQKRLIADNPNLTPSVLAGIIGVTPAAIAAHRPKAKWLHKGRSVPFMTKPANSAYVYSVQCFGIGLVYGGNNFDKAIEQVDRVIFYKEQHNG